MAPADSILARFDAFKRRFWRICVLKMHGTELDSAKKKRITVHIYIYTSHWGLEFHLNSKKQLFFWHRCTTAGWWFQIFFFSPLSGEDFHFDSYFSNGLKPPPRLALWHRCTYNWLNLQPVVVFGFCSQHRPFNNCNDGISGVNSR